MNNKCAYCGSVIAEGESKCAACGAPAGTSSSDFDLRSCPFCHRKLLALASPSCSYCGQRLPVEFLEAHEATLRRMSQLERVGVDDSNDSGKAGPDGPSALKMMSEWLRIFK